MSLGLLLAVAVAAAPIVDGAVKAPIAAATYAGLPRATVHWTVHDMPLTCTGPWLIDVVAAAGVATGEAVRGPALTTLVTVIGADDYRVVFTLGELDRTLGNAAVLLAERCDVLPDDGLRLIPAADRRGGRGVRHVVRITVGRAP